MKTLDIKKDTAKRAAILAAASRLFAGKGFAPTTTAEIAHEAGVAEGTLYHHFDGKDAIFLTLFDGIADEYLTGLRAIPLGGRSGAEALRDVVRFHFTFVAANESRVLLVLRDLPSHLAAEGQERAAQGRRKLGRLTELLAEILARGAADGSLDPSFPPGETAAMMRGLLYGVTRHRMLGLIDVPLPRMARLVEAFCLRALAPTGDPAPPQPRPGEGA